MIANIIHCCNIIWFSGFGNSFSKSVKQCSNNVCRFSFLLQVKVALHLPPVVMQGLCCLLSKVTFCQPVSKLCLYYTFLFYVYFITNGLYNAHFLNENITSKFNMSHNRYKITFYFIALYILWKCSAKLCGNSRDTSSCVFVCLFSVCVIFSLSSSYLFLTL